MARSLAARPVSLPAATLSTLRPPGFAACTTALRRPPGQSGIPEVPSSGLPSPPSSPPLAAITATNELALFPKKQRRDGFGNNNNNHRARREGAALRIREECERFFCETMKVVFRDERNAASRGSSLTGVYNRQNQDRTGNRTGNRNGNRNHSSATVGNGLHSANGQLCTPPDDDHHFPALSRTSSMSSSGSALCDASSSVSAWLEVWDYAGGASFRGFLAEDVAGERSLFAFFDAAIMGRDLKQALMALIELADSVIHCANLVVCVDRTADAADATSLMKGLQWAGFSLTTLDLWTGGRGVDVTSPAWVFMGMEL